MARRSRPLRSPGGSPGRSPSPATSWRSCPSRSASSSSLALGITLVLLAWFLDTVEVSAPARSGARRRPRPGRSRPVLRRRRRSAGRVPRSPGGRGPLGARPAGPAPGRPGLDGRAAVARRVVLATGRPVPRLAGPALRRARLAVAGRSGRRRGRWPGSPPRPGSGATLGADTLSPPTWLSATRWRDVSLSWTATTKTWAAGYHVYRATALAGPYSQIATVTPRTTVTYVDSPADGTYYYTVRAYLQSWESVDAGPGLGHRRRPGYDAADDRDAASSRRRPSTCPARSSRAPASTSTPTSPIAGQRGRDRHRRTSARSRPAARRSRWSPARTASVA